MPWSASSLWNCSAVRLQDMRKPGPPPKPTALKLVAGNPGKRKLPENEPQPDTLDDVAPPPHLVGDARREWKRLAPELKRAGLLTRLDVPALIMYFELFGVYRAALAACRQPGKRTRFQVVATGARGNPVDHPALRTMTRLHAQLGRLQAEFGMTPSSRTRVAASPQDGRSTDWDDF